MTGLSRLPRVTDHVAETCPSPHMRCYHMCQQQHLPRSTGYQPWRSTVLGSAGGTVLAAGWCSYWSVLVLLVQWYTTITTRDQETKKLAAAPRRHCGAPSWAAVRTV